MIHLKLTRPIAAVLAVLLLADSPPAIGIPEHGYPIRRTPTSLSFDQQAIPARASLFLRSPFTLESFLHLFAKRPASFVQVDWSAVIVPVALFAVGTALHSPEICFMSVFTLPIRFEVGVVDLTADTAEKHMRELAGHLSPENPWRNALLEDAGQWPEELYNGVLSRIVDLRNPERVARYLVVYWRLQSWVTFAVDYALIDRIARRIADQPGATSSEVWDEFNTDGAWVTDLPRPKRRDRRWKLIELDRWNQLLCRLEKLHPIRGQQQMDARAAVVDVRQQREALLGSRAPSWLWTRYRDRFESRREISMTEWRGFLISTVHHHIEGSEPVAVPASESAPADTTDVIATSHEEHTAWPQIKVSEADRKRIVEGTVSAIEIAFQALLSWNPKRNQDGVRAILQACLNGEQTRSSAALRIALLLDLPLEHGIYLVDGLLTQLANAHAHGEDSRGLTRERPGDRIRTRYERDGYKIVYDFVDSEIDQFTLDLRPKPREGRKSLMPIPPENFRILLALAPDSTQPPYKLIIIDDRIGMEAGWVFFLS